MGVYLFFGLTGYLLFWPFAKHRFGAGESIDLRRYSLNRFLRIVPLYVAVVVVVLSFQQPAEFQVWARFLLFLENFSAETAAQYIGPAWSLVVELHFYVLLPVLAWALSAATGGSIRKAALILLALAIVSLAVRFETIYTADRVDPIWRLNLPANFMFFVPGMLLALWRVSLAGERPAWLRGPLAQADLWLLASVPFWLVVVLYRFYLDASLCVATLLTVGACVLPLKQGPLTRALQWRPLAIIGVASYSLYLWHVPVLDAIVDSGVVAVELLPLAVLSVPLVIVVSLISYAVIEAPFLRLRGQWATSAARQERPTVRRTGVGPQAPSGRSG